ncbi:hypothetical protein PIB30_098819 [Stylosanthes scabra]|uniref:Putative plant transposon protein domain-containing protein n=1 Tax=Stylosanthes scabra TaxID=79078 RepID=A0ABU6QWP5_9FABA|nr:hypothetical protein [Stylosanthes scabra]
MLEDKHRFNFGVRDSVNLNQAFIMASSSSVSVFDNHRFKTTFNEELYNTIVKNKKVIIEYCIDLDEDEYPEVREQIALRGWRRLSAPKQKISIDLIHEFYANAVVTEEEMEKAGGHTFRSFVRGVPVNFSPGNIRTVMRFRTQVQGATTDFETRKEHDQQLDQVLADLCMPGATWKLSTGEGNEEGNEEEQGYDHDYHHQHDFEQQQPEFEHHQDFNEEPPVQQLPLYHVSTYTDQHQEDLHSIETQLQNKMWYQQQTLNISKN